MCVCPSVKKLSCAPNLYLSDSSLLSALSQRKHISSCCNMSHTCCECNHSIANILSQLSRVSISFHAEHSAQHTILSLNKWGLLASWLFLPAPNSQSWKSSHKPVLTNKVRGPHSRGQPLHSAHMYGESCIISELKICHIPCHIPLLKNSYGSVFFFKENF